MANLKSKLQSYKRGHHWSRSCTQGRDARCPAANGLRAECRLLLRGVALNGASCFSFFFPLCFPFTPGLLSRLSLPSLTPTPSFSRLLYILCTSIRAKGESAHVEKFTEYLMHRVVWSWGRIQSWYSVSLSFLHTNPHVHSRCLFLANNFCIGVVLVNSL